MDQYFPLYFVYAICGFLPGTKKFLEGGVLEGVFLEAPEAPHLHD